MNKFRRAVLGGSIGVSTAMGVCFVADTAYQSIKESIVTLANPQFNEQRAALGKLAIAREADAPTTTELAFRPQSGELVAPDEEPLFQPYYIALGGLAALSVGLAAEQVGIRRRKQEQIALDTPLNDYSLNIELDQYRQQN